MARITNTERIAALEEKLDALLALASGDAPPTPPPAKPKKPAKKPTPVTDFTPYEWWKTDCETTNAYRELKRADKALAKIVRVGCCYDVGLGKFGSMSDVKFLCVNSPDLDFDEVVAANIEWASEGGDIDELDFTGR